MTVALDPSSRAVAWRCPVCRHALVELGGDAGPQAGLQAGSGAGANRRLACVNGHSFDVARQGYVNLLGSTQRRQPGDHPEMVRARQRFLATGAYDPLTAAIAQAVEELGTPTTLLDLGCGDGRHTRSLPAGRRLGIDVAKSAVAAAAVADPDGSYAVASAAALPLSDRVVDTAVNCFGPVVPDELCRVVRRGGWVVFAHPGSGHLAGLRQLVYEEARPHEVKPPLRSSPQFELAASTAVHFPVPVERAEQLRDLYTMTPYRWHAPIDIEDRLDMAFAAGFEAVADVRITTYRRR